MPKNKSTDAAAENASADSLSFAGLVCIEDQQSKSQNIHLSIPPPTNNSANSQKSEHIDFEFSSTVSGSIGPVNAMNNNSLPDVSFSNGQLVAQAIPLQTSQSQANSSRCNNKTANESAKKTNTQVRNKANKQGATVSQWFGQKIIRSFATPCRNCRAIQPSPSMKGEALRQ